MAEIPLEQQKIVIESWQNREPSGPDFTQSTIKYCEEGIGIALGLAQTVLQQKFPPSSSEEHAGENDVDIPGRLQEIATTRGQLKPGFQKDDAGVVRMTVDRVGRPPQKVPVNTKIRDRIESIDPAPLLNTLIGIPNADGLGVGEYIFSLDFKKKGDVPEIYSAFTQSFNHIRQELGNIPLDDPRLQIIATAYILQIAKERAENITRNLVDRALGIESQETLILGGFLSNVAEQVNEIRTHEAFIRYGQGVLDQLTKGLTSEQMQVLYDIAFMKKENFDDHGTRALFYTPLLHEIFQGNVADIHWDEITARRDFLLRYFGDAFPEWRQRDMKEKIGGHFTPDF